jgi:hypothetical protein
MPVPWIQIVRLMPSIIEVSSELLKRTRRSSSTEVATNGPATLEARVAALEDIERRQAELDARMADQLAQLTTAVTALHTQMRRLVWFQVATGLVAVIALVLALVR